MMAEKVGLRDPAEDGLNFSLHECRDGVTSTAGARGWFPQPVSNAWVF